MGISMCQKRVAVIGHDESPSQSRLATFLSSSPTTSESIAVV